MSFNVVGNVTAIYCLLPSSVGHDIPVTHDILYHQKYYNCTLTRHISSFIFVTCVTLINLSHVTVIYYIDHTTINVSYSSFSLHDILISYFDFVTLIRLSNCPMSSNLYFTSIIKQCCPIPTQGYMTTHTFFYFIFYLIWLAHPTLTCDMSHVVTFDM